MLANYINPAVPQLKVGQLVAYDYLYNSKTWQWTLGTVRDLGEYTATVQQWGLHTGNVDTLRSILSREVDGEAARMRNYQDALSIARETLASIRRSNEDRVSAVREHFDKARTALEVVDEVDLRKVTSQAAPSPVAVAVLKAAWSVAKCDPTAVEFFEWADVQLEYRKSNALDNVAKTDVVAKLYPSPETLVRALEQDPKLSYKAAARDSPVVASLHAWVTTALAYQQAYSNLNHDKRIQEQNDAIAAAIAGMKASRAKIATLKDELAAKNASAHPGQVTSFTRTSVLVSIPLSAVICPVNIDSKVEDCVLTNDEVAQILVDAKAMRFQQKEKLNVVVSRLLEQYATATTTGAYAKELEERLFFLQHCYGGILRDAQVAANEDKEQVDDLVRELAAHRLKRFDAKQARANDPDLSGVDDAVQPSSRARSRWRAPESPIEARNGKARRTDSRERDAAAVQPVSPAVIAHEPLFIATADELRKLRDEADKLARKVADQEGKIQKLDKELARSNCNCKDSLSRLQTALDELEGSKEACDKLAAENDKLHRDLEVLQRAAEELDSLKDKLATKDAELAAHRQKRLDAKSARIKDPAFAAADGAGRRSPVSTSRRRAPGSTKDDVGSNRSGAAKQELESALTPVDPVVIKREPLYAVTMDEYKALAAEIAREKEGRSALALENDVLAGELERLQGELQAAQESIADKQRANEAAARALDELAAKDAELAAFRQKRQDAKRARAGEPELVAADDARAHGDADARSDRASIRSTASRSSRGRIGGTRSTARGDSIDAASTPVDPVVIAQEPLYAVTLDEYKAKDAAGNSAVEEAEKLAEELQKEKSEAERLADDLEKAKARSDRVAKKLAAKEDELAQANLELAAFRRKRVEAKKARAAEPELAAANASISTGGVGNADTQSDHGSAPSSSNRSSPRGPTATTRTGAREHPHDVASESVDPAVIAREPLYAVTVEEYSAKHAAGEAATAEAERLADELEAAKGEAEHLATELAAKDAELAAKDAELAAFRQKRQDAKDARANDPELAAADAAASRGKSATSDEGAAADRGAGVGSGADVASRAVDPAVIAEEPLYVATAGEVQQLRDDLEKAKQELDALAGENEKLGDENGKLADELEKLRADGDLLADQLAENDAELAAFRQKRQDAKDARANDPLLSAADGAAAQGAADESEAAASGTTRSDVDAASKPVDPAVIAREPLYAVTVEEYSAKHAAGEAATAEAERLADELEAAKGEAEHLATELAAKDAELAAFRQKRQDAKDARANDPELAAADAAASRGKSATSDEGAAADRGAGVGSGADVASRAVDPAVIAEEPLYVATAGEVQQLRDDLEKAKQELDALAGENEKLGDENGKLADELEKLRADGDLLADQLAENDAELAAFRQKRQDAKDARANDPLLSAADGAAAQGAADESEAAASGTTRSDVDAASKPVDPAVIAREPLYAVTVEEYSAKHAAGEAATAEAERLADELEAAKGEAEHLATELAAKDAELAAFRQKRQDAKDARANDPELAAADAAASRGKSATSDEGAAADRGAGVGSGADVASRAVDPAVIAEEPLYVATAGEVQQLRDDLEKAKQELDALAGENEKLGDENGKLADELEKLRADGDLLADQLAENDAELAAFRQKRQDAKDARANDPLLSAADGAAAQGAADESEAAASGTTRSDVDAASKPVDPAVIAREPLYAVTVEEYSAKHAAGEAATAEAERLADELEAAKGEAEHLATELAAKDAELAAFRQKRQDAKDARANDPELAAADAAASRGKSATSDEGAAADRGAGVGSGADVASRAVDPAVIAEEPLYVATAGEVQQLRDDLEKAKQELDALAGENEKLGDENGKLADELEKLRADGDLLADQLAENDAELAAFRQKRQDAKDARANDPLLSAADGAAAQGAADESEAAASGTTRSDVDAASKPVDPAVIAREPLYAVTVEEYSAKHAAGEAATAEAERLADELEAAKGEAEHLATELAAKDAELAAFRQKRQDAKDARANDPELAAADAAASRGKSATSDEGAAADRGAGVGSGADVASRAVDPAVIAEEPLYVATAGEVQQLRDDLEKAKQELDALAGENEKLGDENGKLADELEKLRADGDLLADQLAENDAELAAFRQKRQDAKDARANDPLLSAADGAAAQGAADESEAAASGTTRSDVDAASKPVDPAVIAREPLYAVTVEEYSAKHAAGEAATAEAERLADELEAAKGEAEHLATELAAKDAELAAKDAELAAFRQKRQDAKDARANDPELAAADAAASRGKSATSDEGAAADRGAGVGSGADAASRAVDPAVIAEEPLYVATAGEVQQLRDDLECRTRALADTEAELDGLRTAVVDKQAECADYADKLDGALGELEKKRQEIDALAEAKSMLEKDLAAQVENNHDLNAENDALKKELDDLDRENKKLADSFANAEDEKHRLCDDLEAALDELEQKKDDYDQLLGNLEQVEGLLEASKAAGRSAVDALEHRNEEMADLQAELAEALRACKENDVLRAQLEEKDREIADLMRHSELWRDPAPAEDAGKAKVTHRFTKIFDGDWTKLIQQRPEALMAAFVIDSSNACHVPGDQINQVAFDHD